MFVRQKDLRSEPVKRVVALGESTTWGFSASSKDMTWVNQVGALLEEFQGSPIELRPDGTFTLRYALPDGKQVIDLTAKSADNKEERTITPKVQKETHRPEPVLSE